MMRLIFSVLLILGTAGCATLPEPEGFTYQEIRTRDFSVASWARVDKKGKLRIYIEGDGQAWLNSYTPSNDPTPGEMTVLKMAQKDTSANVVYLARPCQFIMSHECRMYYWTEGRFDKKVIDSMREAVQKLIRQYPASAVELVGYSGGAAVALLVAKDLPAVSKVTTVAGVLDHKAWTSHHKDSPLTGSLNPAAYKKQLAKIRQIHYAGGLDKNVPASLTENFVYSLNSDGNADFIIVPNATHDKGWIEIWNRLID